MSPFLYSRAAVGEIVVFSKPDCPHCRDAKGLLAGLDLPFTEIDIERDLRNGMLMSHVAHRHTVPQIFFHDEHIGGASELKALGAEAIRARAGAALQKPGQPAFLSIEIADEVLKQAIVPIKDILDPHLPEDPTSVPEYAPVATWYASMFGFLCNLYDQMILKPEPTALWMSTLSALMVPMERKIGGQFGTICFSTAIKAGCSYCSAHGADLAMKYAQETPGHIRALVDYLQHDQGGLEDLPFDPQLRSLINVAAKMTGHEVSVSDIARVRDAFGVGQLREACVSVAAMGGIMGFLNRFNDLIGVEIEASIKQSIDGSAIGEGWEWGTHDTADEVNRYDRSSDSAHASADQPVALSHVVAEVNDKIIGQVQYLFDKYQQFPDDQLPAWIAILADRDVTRAVSCLYHSLFSTGELAAEIKHLAARCMLLGSGYPQLAAEERRLALDMSPDAAATSGKLTKIEAFARSGALSDLAGLDSEEILALRLAKCADSFPHIVRGELVQALDEAYTPEQIVELVMALAVIGIGQRWSSVWEALHEYTLGH
jgi:glutaredoxin 3